MLYVVLILVVLGLDQWSKSLMVSLLAIKDPHIIADGFFKLTMVHNHGAAFGVLQNQRWFFLVATAVVVGGILYLLLKEKNRWSGLEKVALALIAGGALGNALDRVRLGYVVDFLSFTFFRTYQFPTFNVADIAICVGAGLMVMSIIFLKEKRRG